MRAFTLILILLLFTSDGLFAQWTLRQFPTGFEGDSRVHNRSKDTVVAGGGPRNATIWSTDRGQTWRTASRISSVADTVSFVVHCGSDGILMGTNEDNNFNLPVYLLAPANFSSGRNGFTFFVKSTSNSNDYMEDASFVPYSRIGIMVGRPRGYVYRTTDLGRTWNKVNCPNFDRLVRVKFADSQTAYAVGPASQVMKSTDGGLSWNMLSTLTGIGNNKSLGDLDFVTPNIGYIAGGDGLYKTTNGGTSFTKVYNSRVRCVAFWNADNGFISDPNTTLVTTNGGASWSMSNTTLRDISCDKQGYCYGVNIAGVYFYDNPTPVSLEDTWTKEAAFYPNPLASGEYISYYLPPIALQYNLTVLSSSGKVMYQSSDLPQGKGQLPISLPVGLYIVQLQAGGRQWSQKVVVQ